ncbi:hypothetical protein E4U38_006960 [Claviceps purpurea]|nr:hypothetical protein E4U38_006960 [Claviceps purpurea]
MSATTKHPANIDVFNGTEDAGRWLKRLRRSYRILNDNQDVNPSDLVQAIDCALKGEALAFLNSSPHLQDIIDRADRYVASSEDLVALQNALTDRFTVHLVGEKIPVGTNVEIRQHDDEPLDAYHSRVLRVLRRAGGRDKPLAPEVTPLTQLEAHTLECFIHRFVRGLRDKSLMQEAIRRDVLSVDSLKSAAELVKRALVSQESKAEFARYAAQDAKYGLMEEYIRRQSGVSANEELSRAYGLYPGLVDVWGGSDDAPVAVHSLMAQLQPSMAHLGISGAWNGATETRTPYHPPIPRQGQFDWPQQANAFHISAASFQSAYVPATAPAITPAIAPATASAPAPAPVPVFARYARVEVSELCFADEHEEAQIAPVEHVGDWNPTVEAVDVSYAAVNPAVVEVSELCFADEHEEAQIAPVEHVGNCYPTVEVVEVFHATIELSPHPAQCGFHEDADCAQCCATFVDVVEDVAAIEDVTVEDFTAEYLPLRPIQGLKGVDEDASESVARDAPGTMTLISETAPPLGKRESMSVTDVFDEDEIPLSQSVMLVREKTVKRNARALSKMWECEDMRPINWKALTNRLSVQFMGSWQRNSHFCKFSADLHEQRIVKPFDPGGYCDDIWRKATKASTATKLRG